jgi:DNA-binding NtrC family response regulator
VDGKVILIENEQAWVERLKAALTDAGFEHIVLLENFTKAERQLPRLKLNEFALALVDVRMRRPVCDQGGLALLDLIKRDAPGLSAVSQNQPPRVE